MQNVDGKVAEKRMKQQSIGPALQIRERHVDEQHPARSMLANARGQAGAGLQQHLALECSDRAKRRIQQTAVAIADQRISVSTIRLGSGKDFSLGRLLLLFDFLAATDRNVLAG